MKKVLKKVLAIVTVTAIMTVNLGVAASAQCPITSLFGNGAGSGNIFSIIKGGSNSCPSSSLADIFNNKNNSTGSTKNYILDIIKGNYNKSAGNCNSNINCTNGNNCSNNTNCTDKNNCVNGNCDGGSSCPTGNCGTTPSIPNPGTPNVPNPDTSVNSSDFAKEVLKYVNEARTANGLSALALDEKLNQAAGVRASEVGTKFSHTRPDGTSCFTVLKQLGISYKTAGENIASGYKTTKAVVDAWLASPGHRANIMNSAFKYMGLGKSGNNWGQLFIG